MPPRRPWLSVPFSLTVSHYSRLTPADRQLVGKSLSGPEAWDLLRNQGSSSFALPASPTEAALRLEAQTAIHQTALDLHRIIRERKASSVASYGVGAASLEWRLLELEPSLALTLTESAPHTATRLAGLLPQQTVLRHDLTRDPPAQADLHIFHRIDTELDDGSWRGVFKRFSGQTIIVVATELLGPRQLIAGLAHRLIPYASTWAGWLRTRRAFENLWRHTHAQTRTTAGPLAAWLLTPRRSADRANGETCE